MTAAVWIAFAVGACIVGAPLGFIFAAILAAGSREDMAREAYIVGLEKGKALARANVMHDLIAADTAATGADRHLSGVDRGRPAA